MREKPAQDLLAHKLGTILILHVERARASWCNFNESRQDGLDTMGLDREDTTKFGRSLRQALVRRDTLGHRPKFCELRCNRKMSFGSGGET